MDGIDNQRRIGHRLLARHPEDLLHALTEIGERDPSIAMQNTSVNDTGDIGGHAAEPLFAFAQFQFGALLFRDVD
jgi:hypothetical protein